MKTCFPFVKREQFRRSQILTFVLYRFIIGLLRPEQTFVFFIRDSAKLMKARPCSRYSLSSEGLAPKFVCTYRLKCDKEEKPNISLMSVNESERSRSIRLMSSDVYRVIQNAAGRPLTFLQTSLRYFDVTQSLSA